MAKSSNLQKAKASDLKGARIAKSVSDAKSIAPVELFDVSITAEHMQNNFVAGGYEKLVKASYMTVQGLQDASILDLFTPFGKIVDDGNIYRIEVPTPNDFEAGDLTDRNFGSVADIEAGGYEEGLSEPNKRYKQITKIASLKRKANKYIQPDNAQSIAEQMSNQDSANIGTESRWKDNVVFEILLNRTPVGKQGIELVDVINDIESKDKFIDTRWGNAEVAMNELVFMNRNTYNELKDSYNTKYTSASDTFARIQLQGLSNIYNAYEYRSLTIIVAPNGRLADGKIIVASRDKSLTYSAPYKKPTRAAIREIMSDVYNRGVVVDRYHVNMMIDDVFTNMDDGTGNPDGIESEFIKVYDMNLAPTPSPTTPTTTNEGTINSISNTELVENEEGVEVASIVVNATSNFETATLFLLNKTTDKFSKFSLKVAENKDVKWNNQLPGTYQVILKDGETILDSKELTF